MSIESRQGPKLNIVGECDGCDFLVYIPSRSLACGAMIGGRRALPENGETPEWCPWMAEARAALLTGVGK